VRPDASADELREVPRAELCEVVAPERFSSSSTRFAEHTSVGQVRKTALREAVCLFFSLFCKGSLDGEKTEKARCCACCAEVERGRFEA